jgi:hypothetical protein
MYRNAVFILFPEGDKVCKKQELELQQEIIIYLLDFAQKNVLFVEEENAAGLVEKVVVHNLLEQVNALSQPNTINSL